MFENYTLKKTLFREIAHVFEIQFFLEIICVIFGGNLLAGTGFDREMLMIFRYMCLGYMFYALTKCSLILLMYFDARIEAMKLSAVFAVLSILFSVGTLYLGEETFGLGFTVAAVVSCVYGLYLLNRHIKRLEYHVFCTQPLFADVKIGTFETLGGKLNAKLSKKRKNRKTKQTKQKKKQ